MLTGRRPGTLSWAINSAVVDHGSITVTFRDGYVRVLTRDEALSPLPAQFADVLRRPGRFEEGHFDDELGTVVWPNSADLAPEFLRWGPHRDEGCECGN